MKLTAGQPNQILAGPIGQPGKKLSMTPGVCNHCWCSVRVPGCISDEQTVISGVPQGTVLGPVLFLILMSDIDKDISESKVVSFADDTRIYHQIDSDDSTNQLQTDLNKMYDWSVTNNMLFKC